MANLLKKDGSVDKRCVKGPARKLTPKQKQALGLFLSGMNIQSICRTIGIETKTFHNWSKGCEPFKEGLAEAIKGVEQNVGHDLKAMMSGAVGTVSSLLSDPNPNIRLSAAKLAWEMHESMVKRSEEREMLLQLEQRMDLLNQGTAVTTLPSEVIEAKVQVEDQAEQ